MESEQACHDARVQLTTVQGHHKEGMEQLSERSRQLAAHKTELARMQQQNISMRDEVWGMFCTGCVSVCVSVCVCVCVCVFL